VCDCRWSEIFNNVLPLLFLKHRLGGSAAGLHGFLIDKSMPCATKLAVRVGRCTAHNVRNIELIYRVVTCVHEPGKFA